VVPEEAREVVVHGGRKTLNPSSQGEIPRTLLRPCCSLQLWKGGRGGGQRGRGRWWAVGEGAVGPK
jgi:hypothetical protein